MAKFKNTTDSKIRVACARTGFVAVFPAGAEKEVPDSRAALCTANYLTAVGKKAPAKKAPAKAE